jgi:hypothetical protein
MAQTSKGADAFLLNGTLAIFLGLGSGALVLSLKHALTAQAPIGSMEFWMLLAHAALIGVMLLCAMSVWRRRKWGLATLVGAALTLFNIDVFAGILPVGPAVLLLMVPPLLVCLAARANWKEFT